MKIKFGTDGWRGIIAQDFTVENVSRVAQATAAWLKKNSTNPVAVVGHDCRFAGEMFAETTAAILVANGIKVFLAKDFVSTPMISLGTVHYKADAGIIITASHNPPSYNGFKIKASYGGPATPAMIEEVETLIPDTFDGNIVDFSKAVADKKIEYVNLEDLYCEHIEKNFDIQLIKDKKLELAYDAMYGAGQNVIRRLFPEATFLHCDYNPGFMGQAPEPIHKNLQEFSDMIRLSEEIDCGTTPVEKVHDAHYYLWLLANVSGMALGNPPNVSGWPAYYQTPQYYQLWLNSDSLPKRIQFNVAMMVFGLTYSGMDKLQADVIAFAKQTSDPSDPNVLIQECIDLLFAMDISQTQKTSLKQSTLLFGQTQDYYWTAIWSDYIANPTDPDKKTTVENLLKLMLKYLLDLAEHQLA
jgi:hypothetical protein